MKYFRALIAAASISIFHGIAQAQPAAIQQLQNMQQQQLQLQPELRPGTNAPELYTGENEDIGPQRILRVGNQGKAPHRNYLDLNFDTQIFYTDNATFAGGAENRISSWAFVNTAQVAFAPDPYDIGPGKFAPAIGFASQWYNYTDSRVERLDFDAQTSFINLRYLLGYWQFSLGANYTRLASQNTYTETYNEWLPNLSVQRVLPIKDNMAFVLGDAIDYHFTHVPTFTATRNDINDHFDNTIYLTFNWQATSHLVVQPFYRFQYSYYQFDTLAAFKRNDYLSSTGIALLYNFNQHVSLRTYFNYSTKTTDDSVLSSYDELNGGIGGMLDIRF